MRASIWGDEKNVETLKRLWAEGLSCSQIASHIPGTTRNAVIGKVTRLGLTGRRSTLAMKRRIKVRPKRRKFKLPEGFGHNYRVPHALAPRFSGEPLPPPQEFDVGRKKLAELADRECRYPVGNPPEGEPHKFCALPRVIGLPYCEVHARRCYLNPPVRSRNVPKDWVQDKDGIYRTKEFA